jgi:hypothetical protein
VAALGVRDEFRLGEEESVAVAAFCRGADVVSHRVVTKSGRGIENHELYEDCYFPARALNGNMNRVPPYCLYQNDSKQLLPLILVMVAIALCALWLQPKRAETSAGAPIHSTQMS